VRKNASPTGPPTPGNWFDNMENGINGWTSSGLWHQVNNIPTCIPPGYSSPTHSWYYGQDATCNYDTGTTNSGDLTSATIQGATSSSNLSFYYFRQVESYSGPYDITRVDVSGNGGPWTQVWYKDSSYTSENAWTASGNISLSAFNGQDIRLRFFFNTVDSVANNFKGWAIDDVGVSNVQIPTSCTTASAAPGKVLNNLTINKSGSNLVLNWQAPGGSCNVSAYGVYRGTIQSPWSYNYSSLTCTATTTSYTTAADTGNYYFIVVPLNTTNEGSYGTDSSGNQRPPAASPCKPQNLSPC